MPATPEPLESLDCIKSLRRLPRQENADGLKCNNGRFMLMSSFCFFVLNFFCVSCAVVIFSKMGRVPSGLCQDCSCYYVRERLCGISLPKLAYQHDAERAYYKNFVFF